MSTETATPNAEELTRLNSLATEVSIDSIIIGERVRRDFANVPALAEDIRENGLIQPIVLTYDYHLIAGESRIRAHRTLGLTTIRAVFRAVLDEAQLHILECSENNVRQNLTWQERCLSVDRVHRYKSTECIMRGQKWGMTETGNLLRQGRSQTGLCVFVAAALHENNKEVWAAESLTEAYRVICLQTEKEALKGIVAAAQQIIVNPKDIKMSDLGPGTTTIRGKSELTVPSVEFFTPGISSPDLTDEMPGEVPTEKPAMVVPLSRMLLRQDHHSSLQTMVDLPPVDHIICDPPYAIDMDNLQQDQGGQDVSSVSLEHDVDENLLLLERFIPLAFDRLKDRGFLVMWCDPTKWFDLCNQCTTAGFRVQRWPLVWHKTSTCSNQSASTNFTKNIEFAVVARKGNATLISQQPSCVYTGGNDMETRLLGHPFAKPEGLWMWLYKAICQRGQTVLDPFVGVGSSTIPAIRFGLSPIGIECNEAHFGRLLVNVQSLYKSIDSNCTFQ